MGKEIKKYILLMVKYGHMLWVHWGEVLIFTHQKISYIKSVKPILIK
jgi:hypothetical protein